MDRDPAHGAGREHGVGGILGRQRIGEHRQHVVAAGMDEDPLHRLADLDHAVDALADQRHGGGVADLAEELRAFRDVRKQDRAFDGFDHVWVPFCASIGG